MSESVLVRIEVDDERSEHERHRGQRPLPRVELPSVGEVRGQERQHEQTDVAHEPRRLLFGDVGGEPGHLDCDRRTDGEGERLDHAARGQRRLVVASQQLFPQSAAVLACELAGKGVEVAHPLYGDQERLVVREAGGVQVDDLLAKVILELVDVVAVDARGVRHVGPPLGDLRLDALHRSRLAGRGQQPAGPGHTSFSARVTVAHCRRWSASAARPSSVIT